MNAAIYARYSSDAQNPRSLDDQVNECRAVATRRGWSVADDHIFLDAALSGSDTHRPSYLLLKQAALQRQFDHIVVDDLSRLGRDMAESATIFRELSEFGVTLISVADGIDTSNPSAKIPFYFKGIMNEMFLDDMRAKIVRGLKGQVLRGYSAGGRVYGYKTNQILDPSGATDKFGRPKRLGCEVLIDQEQAKIVRRIFEMKASGHGYRSIADVLNQMGVPSPHAGCGGRAGFWSRSTVRALVLQRKYLGDWTWSKTRWLKRARGAKRIKKDRPISEWVKYDCEGLRIISDDLWNAVHLEGIRTYRTTAGPRGSYLLSGVLKCDQCGASLVVQNSGRSSAYICGGFRNGGTAVCSNNHRLSRFVLEEKFCEGLNQVLTNQEVLEELTRETKLVLEEKVASDKDQSQGLVQRKHEIERRLANLVGLVEAGDISQTISRRISELEVELEATATKLARTSNSSSRRPVVTTDLVASVLGDLHGLLVKSTGDSGSLKQTIKNLFPDKLSVAQEEADDRIMFKLNGNLHAFNGLLAPVSLMSHSGAGTRTPESIRPVFVIS
jgi:DNA invertase Pin-like site-specific DNA recombinase